jgi:hypothetical protein
MLLTSFLFSFSIFLQPHHWVVSLSAVFVKTIFSPFSEPGQFAGCFAMLSYHRLCLFRVMAQRNEGISCLNTPQVLQWGS